MIVWERRADQVWLSLSPNGVRFLRMQWSNLRELIRWQLAGSCADPLAELTGLPLLTKPLDGRLVQAVDFWCGAQEDYEPVRQVREGWLLHELDRALGRALGLLPRSGGVVILPAPGHPAVVEWGCMLATLHVILDASAVPDRQRSLRWLELVLETLVQAGHAPARTT